jgi:hypothetical protein
MLRKISLSKISVVAALAAVLVMPVSAYARGGGGGGHMGGSAGHMGGGGHMGGFAGHMGSGGHMMGGPHMGGRFNGGPRFTHFDHFDRVHNFHHFHNRRFFVSNVFFFGGSPYHGYYGDCYWLKRKAIITSSPYWWSRYEDCVGYY